jgi:kynurenine formamidase
MPAFVDLTHPIRDGMVTYPGLPTPRFTTVLSREDSRERYAPGVEFHIGSAELCTNTGTYLDTPFHRYPDGYDLSQLPLERCALLPAVVVSTGGGPLNADALPDDLAGVAVLVHTGWDVHWGTPRYGEPDHPYVTPEAVDRLVALGVALAGIDALNIDSTAGPDRPAHSELLAAGVPVVEHLTNLGALPTRGARFTAVPIPLVGLGTFPVRAFATLP